MKPSITKRADEYVKALADGANTSVLLAEYFGTLTSSAYSMMQRLIKCKVVAGTYTKVGPTGRRELVYTLTGREYTISSARSRAGVTGRRRPAPAVEEVLGEEPYTFFIYPFVDAPEFEQGLATKQNKQEEAK